MSHPYASRPEAATHVWLTPPEIIRALGEFDLDPCAAPSPRPWPTARNHIELPDDGLAVDWKGRVWLNPPYGKNTNAWLAKMASHRNGIALVFARTDTAMFRDHVWNEATGMLFIDKRPHFHRPDGSRAKGNSGGPLVLIAYGGSNAKALQHSGIPGHYFCNIRFGNVS